VHACGARIGEVYLHANPTFDRHWCFKLSIHGEELYRMDVRPQLVRHRNVGCPKRFEGKVRAPEHEHVYVEVLGCNCAQALDGLSGAGYGEVFEAFCGKANLDFQPDYDPPLRNTQVRLL
jgi:hypothetical protein